MEVEQEEVKKSTYNFNSLNIGCRGSSLIINSTGDIAIVGSREADLVKIDIESKSLGIRNVTDHGSIWSLVYLDDNHFFASGASGAIKKYRVHDLEEEQVLRGHTDEVNSLAISSDKTLLFSVSDDRSVRRWNLTEENPQSTVLYTHEGIVYAIDIAPNDDIIASGSSSKQILVFSLTENKVIKDLKDFKDRVWCLKFTHDNKYLVSGDEACEIKLWRCSDWTEEAKVLAHCSRVRSLFVSENSQLIVSGSLDKTIKVWSINKSLEGEKNILKEVVMLDRHEDWVKAAILTSNCETLVSTGDDSNVIIWDLKSLHLKPQGNSRFMSSDKILVLAAAGFLMLAYFLKKRIMKA